MEALDSLVKAGKVRALGASAMYGYQFRNLQEVAEKHGWTRFVSMQNHYNLLYREDERELIPICKQENVSLTPYSPLAAGRLSRLEWKSDSKRGQTDRVAVSKYDTTQAQDYEIVRRVHELSEQHGVTKTPYLDDAVGALDVHLTADEAAYLEELYLPHKIMGAK